MENYADKLLQLAEEGLISYEDLSMMCIKWMSWDELEGMWHANGLDEFEEYDDEDY